MAFGSGVRPSIRPVSLVEKEIVVLAFGSSVRPRCKTREKLLRKVLGRRAIEKRILSFSEVR